MEFLDKITKKASETYKGAAEKTGKIAKEAKLKIKINDNKCKISDLYEEIGKKVYQKHISDEELCIKKDLEEECTKIDILVAEIDNYHKQILEFSDLKQCSNCKENIEKEAKFCPKCGAEQPSEVVETNENLDSEEVKEPEIIEEEVKESTVEESQEPEAMMEEEVKTYTEGEKAESDNPIESEQETIEDDENKE